MICNYVCAMSVCHWWQWWGKQVSKWEKAELYKLLLPAIHSNSFPEQCRAHLLCKLWQYESCSVHIRVVVLETHFFYLSLDQSMSSVATQTLCPGHREKKIIILSACQHQKILSNLHIWTYTNLSAKLKETLCIFCCLKYSVIQL